MIDSGALFTIESGWCVGRGKNNIPASPPDRSGSKIEAPISGIFQFHICTVGGRGDASSNFICVNDKLQQS